MSYPPDPLTTIMSDECMDAMSCLHPESSRTCGCTPRFSVYLAGPMREIEDLNFPLFNAAAAQLRVRGYRVFNPAAGDDGSKDFRDYMAVDLAEVCKADMVVVLPGWEGSQGARLEAHVARECGIPVKTYPDLSEAVTERSQGFTEDATSVRTFSTGATRDTEEGKLDYEGFLSPAVLTRFAEYMHANRMQSDGSVRDSDNWQKGIPLDAYMKSGFRHFMEWWSSHRGGPAGNIDQTEEALCALLFNVQGYLHEVIVSKDTHHHL